MKKKAIEFKNDFFFLSIIGFTCFKNFFENVNKYEHRLKTDGGRLVRSVSD